MFVKGETFIESASRSKIWNDWNDALALLQSAVTVYAVWIGGSFTTSKVDPGDVDVTYIVDAPQSRLLQGEEKKTCAIFATRGAVRSVLGLNVDTFVIPWECIPTPLPPGMDGFQTLYYWARGHWDDWWQRAKQGPKDAPPVPADALPRRGYLEVPVSEYIC